MGLEVEDVTDTNRIMKKLSILEIEECAQQQQHQLKKRLSHHKSKTQKAFGMLDAQDYKTGRLSSNSGILKSQTRVIQKRDTLSLFNDVDFSKNDRFARHQTQFMSPQASARSHQRSVRVMARAQLADYSREREKAVGRIMTDRYETSKPITVIPNKFSKESSIPQSSGMSALLNRRRSRSRQQYQTEFHLPQVNDKPTQQR